MLDYRVVLNSVSILLTIVASYLLGSIPFGYLLVRIFRGEDVRLSGSGNIGATNVSRKSPVLGVLTLLLDALKGSAAVLLANHIFCGPHPAMSMSLSIPRMSLAALLQSSATCFPFGFASEAARESPLPRRIRASHSSRNARSVCYLRNRDADIEICFVGLDCCGSHPARYSPGSRCDIAIARVSDTASHHDRLRPGNRQASRQHPPPHRRHRKSLRIKT